MKITQCSIKVVFDDEPYAIEVPQHVKDIIKVLVQANRRISACKFLYKQYNLSLRNAKELMEYLASS